MLGEHFPHGSTNSMARERPARFGIVFSYSNPGTSVWRMRKVGRKSEHEVKTMLANKIRRQEENKMWAVWTFLLFMPLLTTALRTQVTCVDQSALCAAALGHLAYIRLGERSQVVERRPAGSSHRKVRTALPRVTPVSSLSAFWPLLPLA